MRMLASFTFTLSLLAQGGGYLAPKLPEHIKLQPKPAVEPEQSKAVLQNSAPPRCAHMIVYVPPKVDQKMIIGRTDTPVNSKMPVIKGMDVCPEDVRELRNGR